MGGIVENLFSFATHLLMTETFIIYRRKHDEDLRNRMSHKYKIIALNKFKNGDYICNDPKIEEVLNYYKITRNIAEKT